MIKITLFIIILILGSYLIYQSRSSTGSQMDQQLAILKNIADLKECRLTDDIKPQVMEFTLFDSNIAGKEVVDLIWNDSLKLCGLKFIGVDGYDASLDNYEYEAGFIANDQVIRLRFELFPHDVFPEVDALWSRLGYQNGECNEACYQNQLTYMESFDPNSDLVRHITADYDQRVWSADLKTQ